MFAHFNAHNDDMASRSIEGSLSLMPLSDLIQWIEGSKKSGTLVTNYEDCTRRFFFQEGKLIFVWCNLEGQQLLESIAERFNLSQEAISEALNHADQLGISFIGLLSSEQGIPLGELGELITLYAERSLTVALTWHTGHFRFHDFLPSTVLCGPVTIKPLQVLLDSAVQIDETRHATHTETDSVLNEIFEMIRKGVVDIPPLPADMQLLMDKVNDPNLTVTQIIDCLTDPLLVSKILRICNSPFYGRRTKVDSLRDAVVYMGLKSLMSIVTVNALSGFSPGNIEQVQKILHHCMMVGMIAKQLARDMGSNHDQAFVCGLLHDLGRIVLLEMLSKYNLDHKKQEQLLQDHHQALGALVAKKWNFSEEIQEVIRNHHQPEQALQFPQLVQIIYIANALANNEQPSDHCTMCNTSDIVGHVPPVFFDHLEELDREIATILAPP